MHSLHSDLIAIAPEVADALAGEGRWWRSS